MVSSRAELTNPHEYSAIYAVMKFLQYQSNYPAPGTGSKVLSYRAKNMIGPKIPEIMISLTTSEQLNLFGDYPFKRDIAPSALFATLFSVILIAHVTIFSINCSRGHYFWPHLGFIFYTICRILGFALRIQWSYDLTNTSVGIAAEVFLIVPTVLLASFNLILAQRIFTWRHPVGGSRKLFWYPMIALYVLVAGVVAMTIVAAGGVNIYLLGAVNYARFQKVIQTTSILIIVYSLTGVSLIGLAFFFKPTPKDINLYTYQPWWIESFSPSYFVRKGEPQEAAASFLKRNHNHRYAIRVIAATHHHYKMVKGLSNKRGDLTHNMSMFIIFVTTFIILLGAILRSVVCFQGRYMYDRSAVGSAAMMYVFWGALEVIVNLIYIFGRIDLRFYRPDRLPKDIKFINTAEQSLYPSEIESVDIDKSGRLRDDASQLSRDHTFKDGEEGSSSSTSSSSTSGDDLFFGGGPSDDESEGFDFMPVSRKGRDKDKEKLEKPSVPSSNHKLDVESEFRF
ncbi:uncharacterized protein LODBEIA_P56190 [Lodderomyces beijingensis]|uniref:Uncharacterized protein n=1 Tax=Lodderomyces beijingensis TaxID=1775926 RepID=A0ABP0ZTD5_9ASCO